MPRKQSFKDKLKEKADLTQIDPLILECKKKLGRPRKFNTAEEMETVVDEYFELSDAASEPYTMSGLALFLGMSRMTLLHYKNNPSYEKIVNHARQRVEAHVEKLLLSGMPATGPIFNMKNNFQWKDQQDLDITTKSEQVFDKDQMRTAAQEILKEDE